MADKKLAVISVRGEINLDDGTLRTLRQLNIEGKHVCVVVIDNPTNNGMIKKVESYVTWGEIDDVTYKELLEKRGEETTDNEGNKVLKKYFRLHPPRKGFERKGIKKSFNTGGALGYRGEKINDLIKRML